jgi:hypothetical protein
MRMGDDFLDAGLVDELADASRAVGRGGVDARHSPATAPASSADAAVGSQSLLAAKGGIGATGQIGETALAQLGGKSQVFFQTSQGGRYVDQLVGGIANESKVGYQSLSSSMRTQVMKDVELMGTGKIDGAIWNFYRSPVTGKIGPSGPLGDLLNQNNIPFGLHY